MHHRPCTETLYQESCALMPGGVSSPVRTLQDVGILPLMVEEGRGDLLYDVDGFEYIDFCNAWGSLILGHVPESITSKVILQLKKGSSFGIATPYERDLAKEICKHIPSMQKLRFVSSGTEATMTAIRLARGFTGKRVIVKFDGHYHGHSDSLLVNAGSGVSYLSQASSQGVVEGLIQSTLSLPFNDLALCRNLLRSRDDLACVILEPVAGNMGVVPADPEFLEMLREETARKGILLIFDEVITGFRVGLKGAQRLFGITPDLTCLGKIIGGGLPVAALGGRQEIMDYLSPMGPVYQAGTLSGNPLAMCAGLETLKQIEQPTFYDSLQEKTERFLTPLRNFIAQKELPIAIQNVGSMFSIFFGVKKVTCKNDLISLDKARFKEFFLYLFDRGIYLSPSPYETHFISEAHTEEHLEETQTHILSYLKGL